MARTITRGENPTLTLTAQAGSSAFNLTGATSITTTFKKADGTELVVPYASHAVVTAADGIYTCQIPAADTATLLVGEAQTFFSKITIAGKDYYVWYDGLLNVRDNDLL